MRATSATINSDEWVSDFLNEFKDDRMTVGWAYNQDETEKMFAVRIENEVIATAHTLMDVVWSARKVLSLRKVRVLCQIDDILPEEVGRALKVAAQYLDGKEFTALCLSMSDYPKIQEAVKEVIGGSK